MSRYIVGLTGGIGSGKTTVANLFGAKGIDLVDADIVAREIVEPGQPALEAIAERFGTDILANDGSLRRAQLRQIVFTDPQQRIWLEQLTHPLIRRRILDQLNQAQSSYAMLVSPLLLETNQRQLCNHILVVDLPESLQLERTARRDNNSLEQVKAIMKAQTSRANRLKQADSRIDNSQQPDSLNKQVDDLHQQFLSLATAHNETR
ncbi:dephospho-CoA kinase [Motiliproteus coralliicola]|uniref:Dephospho-CoA kinase n=1 Tax=Motiliproteus coralliicola TaxID=2283196 RepID=A0A369WNK7_9GAMM|nr:dephospho-CoA kinase [Motiliproteus coralliicola]RDE22803.1 dephospho-CoA kinase [Motiliproteus coralliicola]